MGLTSSQPDRVKPPKPEPYDTVQQLPVSTIQGDTCLIGHNRTARTMATGMGFNARLLTMEIKCIIGQGHYVGSGFYESETVQTNSLQVPICASFHHTIYGNIVGIAGSNSAGKVSVLATQDNGKILQYSVIDFSTTDDDRVEFDSVCRRASIEITQSDYQHLLNMCWVDTFISKIRTKRGYR